MNLTQNMEQLQIQKLSQNQIESLQLLQMPVVELKDYLEKLSEENPVMELHAPAEESIDKQNWLNSLNEENHYLYQKADGDDCDTRDLWDYGSDMSETIADYLRSQIISESWTGQENLIIDFLLNSLDHRGYLTESAESAANFLGCDEAMVRDIITKLQSLEPVGICAESLSDCLLLQLKRKGLLSDTVRSIIEEDLQMVADNRIAALSKKYHLPKAQIASVCDLIRSLDPNPGSSFGSHENMKYIIPDVMVVRFREHFDILLNDSFIPGFSMNKYYMNLMETTDQADVKDYLEGKIRQIRTVKESLRKRNRTLLALSGYIIDRQTDFFRNDTSSLCPMSMKEAAEAIGVHESTISRAAEKKYLECARGTFPLSFFFKRNHNEKDALLRIIQNEDKKKPLSDQSISERLKAMGYSVSRRTVTKYREAEGIPDSSGRKEY